MSPTSELVATPRITPYKAADARGIRFTPQALASQRNIGDLEQVWREYETKGPAWTLWVGDEVVACAGLILLWRGVGHAWLLPSVTMALYPRTVVMQLVTHLHEAILAHKLVRIECHVEANFRMGCRLVEWLGFVPEDTSLMARYGPNDEDFRRYVLIQPREPA